MYFKEIVIPICEYAKQKCQSAGIPFTAGATTNAYFLTPDIHKELEKLNFAYFQITLDGVRNSHNNVKFMKNLVSAFDRTLTNINNLLSTTSGISVILRINFTQSNLTSQIIDEINGLISTENRHKIHIIMKKVWQEDKSSIDYSAVVEILKSFRKSGYRIDFLESLPKAIPCYASKRNYAAINYNGEVVKCTASDDLYEGGLGLLNEDGSIWWKDGVENKYMEKSFENKKCLECKYLPICYGVCPKDNITKKKYCKLKANGFSIKDLIVSYIDDVYSSRSKK